MNMKTILLAAVLGFAALGSAMSFAGNEADAADESPIELYVAPDFECYSGSICVNYFNWTVTALEDGVIVKDIIVNRGNCKALNNYPDRVRYRALRYGDNVEYRTGSNDSFTKCKPLEAEVVTNKGTWKFNMR